MFSKTALTVSGPTNASTQCVPVAFSERKEAEVKNKQYIYFCFLCEKGQPYLLPSSFSSHEARDYGVHCDKKNKTASRCV